MGYYKSIYTQVELFYYDVVELFYYDGYTPIEIAEITGLSFDEVVSILTEVGELA